MNKLFIIYILWFLNIPNSPNLHSSKEEKIFSEIQHELNYHNKDSNWITYQSNKRNNSFIEAGFTGFNLLNLLPGSFINKITGVPANISISDALISFSGNLMSKSIHELFNQSDDSIPNLNDIQAKEFIYPLEADSLSFGTTISPQVSFTNNSTEEQTNVPVKYKITDSTGNIIYNDSAVIPTIDTLETLTVTFPESNNFTLPGTYIINSYSELTGDEITGNDTITGYIAVSPLLHDIKPELFLTPLPGDTLVFGTRLTPGVSFRNNGSLAQTNVPVRYVITDSTGNEIYNRSVIIPLIESGETENIYFTESDSFMVNGIYKITAVSELPGDQITSNDSIIGSITVLPFEGDPAFNVTWIDRPVNFQLYPREDNDSGNVSFVGLIYNYGNFYDTCLTKVYRNGALIRTTYQLLSYAGDTAGFSITDKIKAERSEYKITFSLRKPSGAGDTLLYTADSLVSGDTYLINGQSNVYFAPTDGGLLNFKNEYIRTFGIQTDSLNAKAYDPKDTTWGRSSSFFNITSLSEGHPGNVGGIGQFLQRYILDTFNIPTCFINGSVNNTSIKTHTRNKSNPSALNTLYGKLLYRTHKAKLQNKIKAIIWFQGETDNSYATSSPSLFNPKGITDPYGYPAYFDSLYKGWVTDYDFEKVYVFQIRQVACSYQNRQSVFREVQRQLQTSYHDTVQVIPTVGIGYRAGDNCHYTAAGYDQLAHNLFRRLRQDFYSITDSVDMRPPDIVKVFYASFDKKKIGMLLGGSIPGYIPADSLGKSIKNYFYLNNIRTSDAESLTLSNDTLILTMPESQSASYINYLPNQDSLNIYNGPFIRNSRGIAMLTFDSVYIEPYDGPPMFDIQATAFQIPLPGDTLSFGSVIIPQVIFRNNAVNNESNIEAYFRLIDSTGNEIYSDSAVITTIESGDSLNVTFGESQALTSAGNYTIISFCKLPGDQVTINDTITESITISPVQNDIQTSVFIAPVSGDTLAFGSVVSPQVSFTNNGVNAQSNLEVYFKLIDSTGNEIYSDSAIIGLIDTAETLTVNFPESSALTTPGSYIISSYSVLPEDQITNNDSLTGSIIISPIQNDIQTSVFIAPVSGDTLAFGSVVSPQVSYTNNGVNNESNIEAYFRLIDSTGNEIYIDSTVITTIESGESLNITFGESQALTSAGNYTIISFCELPGDQITINDTITESITISPVQNDIQTSVFIAPVSGDTLAFGSVISPQVSFTNNGVNAQSNIEVYLKLIDSTGNEIYSDSAIIGLIDTAETLTVNFPESSAITTPGSYIISSYSVLPEDQITNNDSLIGSIIVAPQLLKFIDLRFGLEAMYPAFDTVRVYLTNSFPPYQVIDSSVVFSQTDSLSYTVFPSFANADSGNSYYIIIRHRNSIETWSAITVAFTSDTISYNFTTSSNMAYSDNMKLIGNSYRIFSGDENQDRVIELSDVVNVFNSARSFTNGYSTADMNGDYVTDLSDIVVTLNNANDFVSVIIP